MKAARFELADEVGYVRDVPLELGGAAADVGPLVSIAGGDGGQPKALAQRLREGVLTLAAAAVERFDSADVSVGGVGDGALQRLRPVALIA